MAGGIGCLCFKRRGGFNRVHATYRTKYAYSDVNAISPSLLSCLVNTGETIAGATFGGA